MDQQKLFYNVCNDLWTFSKTLDKKNSEMTDVDWTNAISLMEKTAEKYKSLGDEEYKLAFSTMMSVLDYLENRKD